MNIEYISRFWLFVGINRKLSSVIQDFAFLTLDRTRWSRWLYLGCLGRRFLDGGGSKASQDEVRRELADLFLTFNNVSTKMFQLVWPSIRVVVGTSILLGGFIRWLCADCQELLGEEAVNAYFSRFWYRSLPVVLNRVTPGKGVVLGMTSKSGQWRTRTVIARIKETSQYVSLENLCLSTQWWRLYYYYLSINPFFNIYLSL